jgi:replicative DNA helicase
MIKHKKEKSEIVSSEIYIVKHRDGATGAVPVRFIGKQTMFVDVPLDELGPNGFVE